MRLRFLLLTSLLLLAVALGTMLWLEQLDLSLASYHSPLRSELPLGRPTTPFVRQVVLVVVEGLSDDQLAQMPALNDLRRRGAWATLRTAPYTDDLALLTGASPELSGRLVLPSPARRGAGGEVILNDLFSALHRAGNSIVLAGPRRWAAVAPAALDEGYVPAETGPLGDAAIVRQALRRLDYWIPELQVVILSQIAALPSGPQSPAAVQTVDSYIVALWQMAQMHNPGNAVLVVLGNSDGAPIIITGKGIIPGWQGDLATGDVTLTVAALLGAPLPNAAQGQVLFSLFRMDQPLLAEKQIALAQARLALADAYLFSIRQGATGEVVENDLAVARSALVSRNYDSAYRLASQAVRQATQAMSAGRAHRLDDERRLRWPILLLAVFPLIYALVSLFTAVAARRPLLVILRLVPRPFLRPWQPATVAGTTVAAIAWSTYRLWGQARPVWESLLLALCLGMLIVLEVRWIGGWSRDKGGDVGLAACNLSLTFVYLLLLPLAWLYYQEGALVTWYLPAPETMSWWSQTLAQGCLAALLAIPLLWLATGVEGLLCWWQHRPRVQVEK